MARLLLPLQVLRALVVVRVRALVLVSTSTKLSTTRWWQTGALGPLPAVLLFAACAHAAPASETLPRLKLAIASEVVTPEQNAQNSALVEQINNDKQLQGLSREEVSERLGRGDLCSRHPICGERGFEGDDWYYEIGRESSSYLRHRPALILGFGRFGKVERSFVLRAPE